MPAAGSHCAVGPYLLCQPLSDCPWIACYRARHVESGDMARLAVADAGDQTAEELLPRLQALAAAADRLTTEHLLPILRADRDGGRIWAAARWLEGRTAAAWMVHHGRFPPDAVLEIARAMTAGLLVLEEAGLCHGDVAAQSLLLTGRGGVALLQPGLRPILRPEEGYAHADLQPEAYDYLAPERIAAGASPDTAGDVYACGCLWWHLLCGRPPLAGGDSLAKLRAGHAATIVDVRRFARAAPGLLVETIAACVRREPAERPGSIAQLAEMLGRPARNTRQALGPRYGALRTSGGALGDADSGRAGCQQDLAADGPVGTGPDGRGGRPLAPLAAVASLQRARRSGIDRSGRRSGTCLTRHPGGTRSHFRRDHAKRGARIGTVPRTQIGAVPGLCNARRPSCQDGRGRAGPAA